jgi:hypothetical protein
MEYQGIKTPLPKIQYFFQDSKWNGEKNGKRFPAKFFLQKGNNQCHGNRKPYATILLNQSYLCIGTNITLVLHSNIVLQAFSKQK